MEPKLKFDFTYNIAYETENAKKTLYLVRGVPGAGKSTMAKHYFGGDDKHVILEADMFFSRYGEYQYRREDISLAHAWCRTTAEVMLTNNKQDVVVANTFTRFSEMEDYVRYAKKYNYNIVVITMASEYGSIHGVPEESMIAMRNRFESHETVLEKILAYRPD